MDPRQGLTLALAALCLASCPRSRGRVVVREEEHDRQWLASVVQGDQGAADQLCQFTVFSSTRACHVCGEREVSGGTTAADDAGLSFSEVKTVPFELDLQCREETSICRRDVRCDCLDLQKLDPDVELLERLQGQGFCR